MKLTKAHRVILPVACAGPISYEAIARVTGLAKSTVQLRLGQLVDWDLLVVEERGQSGRPARYRPGPEATELLHSLVPISVQSPVDNSYRFLPGTPGTRTDFGTNSVEKSASSTDPYKESLFTRNCREELVSECAGRTDQWKTHPLIPETDAAFEEVVAFGEDLTGFPFDGQVRARCAELIERTGIRPVTLTRFFTWKHEALMRRTQKRWRWISAGSIVKFAQEEMGIWRKQFAAVVAHDRDPEQFGLPIPWERQAATRKPPESETSGSRRVQDYRERHVAAVSNGGFDLGAIAKSKDLPRAAAIAAIHAARAGAE